MGSSRVHATDYRQFCALLRAWRISADLSQRALAEKLNQTQCYIYKCEAGERRLDPVEWVAWLDATGVSPNAAYLAVRKLLP